MIALHTSQSLAASGGRALHPVKATASSPLVALHVRLTSGATPPDARKAVTVVLAASAFDLPAAEAPETIATPLLVLDCLPSAAANGEAIYTSEAVVAPATTLYAWIHADELGETVTLDVTAAELS